MVATRKPAVPGELRDDTVPDCDYSSAFEVAKRGLQHKRVSVPLLYLCAVALFRMKQFHESLAKFDEVLSLEPSHVFAINERGSVLGELKDHDAALECFDKALSVRPEYAEAYLNKGSTFGALKRYDEASAAYERALALKPDLAEAWVGRGNSLAALGRL